jgi:ribonucleotide monophosphatase NagD (HAD superfamily)
VIGKQGIINELKTLGIKVADERAVDESVKAVIVGFDDEFTFQKLAIARGFLCGNGNCIFLASNRDHSMPTEDGLWPGI